MKNIKHILAMLLLSAGFLFACRGGANKNNDHDYNGKNSNNDGSNSQQLQTDSGWQDTISRYPIENNGMEKKK